jgi:phosphoserine phosphatase
VSQSKLEKQHLFGYGNTKSDIPFLSLTGNPVVVHPDKKLSRHASASGWRMTTTH